MIEYKEFTDVFAQDVKSLVQRMFNFESVRIIDKILSNPVRRKSMLSAGDVAINHGEVIGFQAAIHRRVYVGQREIIGIVGSTLCLDPRESPEVVLEICNRTLCRHDASIFFGNTACKAAMRVNKLLDVKSVNLLSYRCQRSCRMGLRARLGWFVERVVTRLSCGRVISFSRPKSASLRIAQCDVEGSFSITGHGLNDFWERYLVTNRGLVCSRTESELEWVHGGGLSAKRRMLITVVRDGQLIGYVIVRANDSRYRKWDVIDWIALNNEMSTLDLIIRCTIKYMSKFTGAARLSIAGFSTPVQQLLSRHFPLEESNQNFFCYKIIDKGLFPWENCFDTLESWFYGPYDGDECLL